MSEESVNKQQIITLERLGADEHTVGGSISITSEVVATIAEIAARAVPGVHSLGRWRFVPFSQRLRRGVAVELGAEEAALDLEVVLEFGTDIRKLATAVRAAVAEAIATMADRRVVEVNLKIAGIELPRPRQPQR